MGEGMARKFWKARILSSNPGVGVNRRAILRRPPEKNGAERRRNPRRRTHRDSPSPHPPRGTAPQVVGYVEESTTGSRRRTESADVNHRGKQIRVKMIWLPE